MVNKIQAFAFDRGRPEAEKGSLTKNLMCVSFFIFLACFKQKT